MATARATKSRVKGAVTAIPSSRALLLSLELELEPAALVRLDLEVECGSDLRAEPELELA